MPNENHPASRALPPQILVVDDEPAILRMVKRILLPSGVELTLMESPVEALALLEQRKFDVVISDIGLPDMNGLQLLREIRKLDLDVPVVFMTGAPSLDTAMEAIRLGALHYFKKPFDNEDFVATVQRAVKLGRMANARRQMIEASGLTEGIVADLAGTSVRFDNALSSVWMAFQPIVNANDYTIHGYEALLRSRDPILSNPGLLLAGAEAVHRLPELSRVIRAHVTKDVLEHTPVGDIFVNLHPADLTDNALLADDNPLHGIAQRVVLELTERASILHVPELERRAQALRAMGYRFALDDIGAGYASLSSFVVLEPEIVKIDMFLVRDINANPVKQKLVHNLVDLCHSMEMQVVAEGVETAQEAATLTAMSCDMLQGYYFSRPAEPFPGVTVQPPK